MPVKVLLRQTKNQGTKMPGFDHAAKHPNLPVDVVSRPMIFYFTRDLHILMMVEHVFN
jgi:hypothetical protein